ncbi:MAG: hypothetical protein Q8S53_16495 [Brevundimonas sp.]|uniref:hypothetical protein n=1 Tax=Brevundimonas sp. TaxID=1871086 RepID=UPI0027365AAE|nr:hypothetical protein [Brevundimonas sp.]MDP3379965.1 hypothetical protein [Brevundimonas sp.]
MRIIALIIVGLVASGCSTIQSAYETPTVVSASDANITYQYRNGRYDSALQDATKHCATHGRTAQMVRVLPAQANHSTATFNCV